MSRMTTSGALIAALCWCPLLLGQQASLRASVAKEEFFEGEPVFIVFQLQNEGFDTVWIAPFALPFQNLRVTVTRSDGAVLKQLGFVADFFPGLASRGEPLGPGESTFTTVVMQDYWGEPGPSAPNLFLHDLKTGDYQLTAWFQLHGESSSQSVTDSIQAPPVSFRIRLRTPAEEGAFAEVKSIRDMAWSPGDRRRYLSALINWTSQHAASDAANPYLPFLLHNGLQTAWAIGQPQDAKTASQVRQLRSTIVEHERTTPGGSYLVTAIAEESPALLDELIARLEPSLVASVARSLKHRGIDTHRRLPK